MSSTAIVSKLLAERGELDSAHGREVIGVLLFQDLAVVPLLVLIPALGQPADAHRPRRSAAALAKAAAALGDRDRRRAAADAGLAAAPWRGAARTSCSC